MPINFANAKAILVTTSKKKFTKFPNAPLDFVP